MGVRGEEVGSQLILIGNISVRDQCVQVSLFFVIFTPNMNLKLFSRLHTPLVTPMGASLRGDFFLLF